MDLALSNFYGKLGDSGGLCFDYINNHPKILARGGTFGLAFTYLGVI